jgi:TRAP-type mannitol/chloroaromatic compound transport system permease small subunit
MGTLLRPVIRPIQALSRLLALLAAVLVVVLIAATLVDAASRNITGVPLRGLLEWSETLLVVLIFLGMPYTMQMGAHVSIDSFVARLSPRNQRIVVVIGFVVALPVLIWAAWSTVDIAFTSFQDREARMGLVEIPLWPARAAVALGMVLFALEAAIHVLRVIEQGPAAADTAEPEHAMYV